MKKKENNKVSTINKFNILFVDIQIVLTLLTVILGIVYIFNNDMKRLFQLSLGSCLLIMAYNNYRIYKRKNITIIYAIVGILLIILGILGV